MNARTVKIAATATVLVAALSGLMYTTLSEGTEYYKHVDEVMADPTLWHGKRMSLHGFVVDKSIYANPKTLEYRFQVQSNGKIVAARYTGVVPDTFKDGSEVVLKGQLGPHSGFRPASAPEAGKREEGSLPYEFEVAPNGVMAKCPSKYEASKTPGTPKI